MASCVHDAQVTEFKHRCIFVHSFTACLQLNKRMTPFDESKVTERKKDFSETHFKRNRKQYRKTFMI